jgi:hypothetical protein
MDTFLPLVLALGCIANGIGAIWTAVFARRQARPLSGSDILHNVSTRAMIGRWNPFPVRQGGATPFGLTLWRTLPTSG